MNYKDKKVLASLILSELKNNNMCLGSLRTATKKSNIGYQLLPINVSSMNTLKYITTQALLKFNNKYSEGSIIEEIFDLANNPQPITIWTESC